MPRQEVTEHNSMANQLPSNSLHLPLYSSIVAQGKKNKDRIYMDNLKLIIDIIKTIRNKITVDTDVVYAGYNSVIELQTDIDKDLDALEKGDFKALEKFKYRFGPTATFQELSLSNVWGDEFLILAERFDATYEKIKNR